MIEATKNNLQFTKNLLSITSLMGAYAGQASFGKLRVRDHRQRVDFFTRNVAKYTQKALGRFNFEVQTFNYKPELMKDKNYLFVSNHLSYLDIMVLSSIQPCVFVTSVDMGETPFLGQMAEMGGSLFVERRNRSHIGRDIGMMADTLREGHNVVIYPEGTSSNGEHVLPFKKSLLMSAVDAGVDLMPVIVKYTEINGRPFSRENRDLVCWYGDMPFFPHFLGLMTIRHAKVELHFGDPIKTSPQSTRHELAEKSFAVVNSVYGRPLG